MIRIQLVLLSVLSLPVFSQSGARSFVDTSWRGAIAFPAKGNSPAQLKMVMQNGNLTGIVTCNGTEETMVITFSGTAGIRMKGVSVRDLQHENRRFNLDTFNGEVSSDGRRIQGVAIDTDGHRAKWEFSRSSGR